MKKQKQYALYYCDTYLFGGTRKELADYLGVNRSALMRELKNLKEERFIETKGHKIKLLY